MKKIILLATFLFLFSGLASAQVFTFYPQTTNFTAGSTNTTTFCAVQTGSGVGSYQNLVPENYLAFRFGAGFGTLNSVSNLRINNWFLSTPSATPVTVADFSVTTNALVGKVVLEYESLDTKQLAYRDQICLDVNWTAPATPTESTVDFFNNVASMAHSETQAFEFFVR